MDTPLHLDSVEEQTFQYLLTRYHEGKHTVDYVTIKTNNGLSDQQCETIITLFRELGVLSQHYTKPFFVIEKRILLLARELATATTSGRAVTSDIDLHRMFMERAIEEAGRSASEDVRVHPRVGVVIVKAGKELATAYRGELAPGDHAEFTALEKKLANITVAGATVYTTLEPCTTRNHPKIPCAERLIERKVKRVVIGMLDPNDSICGKGVRRLRKANIIVEFFPHDLMSEIEEMNREFARHHDSAKDRESNATQAERPNGRTSPAALPTGVSHGNTSVTNGADEGLRLQFNPRIGLGTGTVAFTPTTRPGETHCYLRVAVQTARQVTAKSCHPLLVRIEKENSEGGFQTIHEDPLPLAWSSYGMCGRDIPPGIPFYFDFARTTNHTKHLEPQTGAQATIWCDVLSEPGVYRFTVAVSAENMIPAALTVYVEWRRQWNSFKVGVHSPSFEVTHAVVDALLEKLHG